jgi:hypothetical protein
MRQSAKVAVVLDHADAVRLEGEVEDELVDDVEGDAADEHRHRREQRERGDDVEDAVCQCVRLEAVQRCRRRPGRDEVVPLEHLVQDEAVHAPTPSPTTR